MKIPRLQKLQKGTDLALFYARGKNLLSYFPALRELDWIAGIKGPAMEDQNLDIVYRIERKTPLSRWRVTSMINPLLKSPFAPLHLTTVPSLPPAPHLLTLPIGEKGLFSAPSFEMKPCTLL